MYCIFIFSENSLRIFCHFSEEIALIKNNRRSIPQIKKSIVTLLKIKSQTIENSHKEDR